MLDGDTLELGDTDGETLGLVLLLGETLELGDTDGDTLLDPAAAGRSDTA
jgi:hypothetical protein